MTRPEAVEAARQLITERFSTCQAAFLAGSVVRGDATPNSDLDIVIVTTDPAAPFRESLVFEGWPVELFVHTVESIRQFFASDARRRMPSLPMMCAEAEILNDVNGLADTIRAEALSLLEQGPPPLTGDELNARRYRLTDGLDDLEGSEVFEETLFIAGQVSVLAAEFVLAYHGCWHGQGKWVTRALRRYDPALADRLVAALLDVYRQDSKHRLITFVDDILAPAGGRLFAGYRQAGKNNPDKKKAQDS